MGYCLVRAKWGGVENKKAEFINNDEWIILKEPITPFLARKRAE